MQRLRSIALNTSYDLAIVGSGFAGSLMAMIARRLGLSVVLLERGSHPRFAIGESSTPLANLLLEQLARDYDLPQLNSLSRWGHWQRDLPHLACGLKRGFSFYQHRLDTPFAAADDRSDQMLVAASPHDAIADTHWYRPDLDHYLVREAEALGVNYRDHVQLDGLAQEDDAITLRGTRTGRHFRVQAKFLIDASGSRGFLHRTLRLDESKSEHRSSQIAFFSHFRDVKRLADLREFLSEEAAPYPIDDAAVHHVFDGGWIWVLRFNNGLISAGASVSEALAAKLNLCEGEAAWQALLCRLPVVQAQFADARAQCEFVHAENPGFRSSACAGGRWALLPSAAGFADPMLSSGFPLTLLGITRIASAIREDWESAKFSGRLREYEKQTLEDLIATERLVGALHASMGDFPLFTSIARLYFAAASFTETARRLGSLHLTDGYLMHDHPEFGPRLLAICDQVIGGLNELERNQVMADIDTAIEPIDIAGLSDHRKRNWYPVVAADLLDSASKLGVSRHILEELLERSGFHP